MFRNVTDPSLISTGSTPVTLKKQEPLPFKLLSSIYHPPPSSIIVSSVSSKSDEREFDANCMELLLFFVVVVGTTQFHGAAFDESDRIESRKKRKRRRRSDVAIKTKSLPASLRFSFVHSGIRAIPTTNLSPALHLVRARLNLEPLGRSALTLLDPFVCRSPPIEAGDPRSITLGVRGGINIMKTKDSGQRGEIWRVPEREREDE